MVEKQYLRLGKTFQNRKNGKKAKEYFLNWKNGIRNWKKILGGKNNIRNWKKFSVTLPYRWCKIKFAVVPSTLHMRKNIPRARLTSMYQQPMTQIAVACEACGLGHWPIYTSQREAAAPRIVLSNFYFSVYQLMMVQRTVEGCINEINACANDAPTILRLWDQNSQMRVLSFHQASFDAFDIQA